MQKDKLVRAVVNALEGAKDQKIGLATVEIARELGWSRRKVRKALHRLYREGEIEVVKSQFERIDGTKGIRPTYRLIEQEEKDEK